MLLDLLLDGVFGVWGDVVGAVEERFGVAAAWAVALAPFVMIGLLILLVLVSLA